MGLACAKTGTRTICGLVFTALMASAPRAHACSCGANGEIAVSQPANGATDVPTNFAPYVTANVADWPAAGAQTDSVVLLDEAGNVVPADRRTFVANALICTAQIEWIPSEPLKPNHTYTIVVQQRGPDGGVDSVTQRDDAPIDSISFTTGSTAMVIPAPTPPEILTSLFHTANASTCDISSYQGCVTTREPQTLEVITSGSSGVTASALVEQRAPLYFPEDSEEKCLEVRARDFSGRRSDPTELCEQVWAFQERESAGGLTAESCQVNVNDDFDSLPPEANPTTTTPTESEGCTLTHRIPASTPWSAILTLAAALVARRRHAPRS